MNRIRAFAILAGSVMLAGAPLAAQTPVVPRIEDGPQMTAAEAEGVQQAIDLGARVYAHDQAAWHGTDAMLAAVPDARERGVAGWIVNEAADGLEVVFFRPAGGGYEAVWAGVYDGRKVIRSATYAAGERVLAEAEIALVKASLLLRKQKVERCSSQPFNTVILPTGKPDGGLYAYLLTPQEALDKVPFGGHHRFEIVGGKIKGSRKFTNSCLTMQTGANKDGNRPAALMISHVLDSTPTEIHVFSAYAARLAVFVSTTANGRVWSVEVSGGEPRIRILR